MSNRTKLILSMANMQSNTIKNVKIETNTNENDQKFVKLQNSCTITQNQITALSNVTQNEVNISTEPPQELANTSNTFVLNDLVPVSVYCQELQQFVDLQNVNNVNATDLYSDDIAENVAYILNNNNTKENWPPTVLEENIELPGDARHPLILTSTKVSANEQVLDIMVSEIFNNKEALPLNEVQNSNYAVTAQHEEKGYTKSGNPRKRRKIVTDLATRKQEKLSLLMDKHPVKQGCGKSCKKKCSILVNENRRKQINNEFWKMTNQERKTFVLSFCKCLSVKRRTVETDTRKNTFKYYLKNENDDIVEVCKLFYLTSLGYKKTNDRFIHDTLKKTPKGNLRPLPDLRGKHPCKRKIDDTEINIHIESFNPVISHYRREHAPRVRYLPSDISVSTMFNDFKAKYTNMEISYETYRMKVKAKNISFAKLGNEECEACEQFKLHEHSKDDLQESCDVCNSWKKHINNADMSRRLYGEQAGTKFDDGTICISADLQKIIMLPRADSFKKVIFVKRLIAYHESFVPLGKNSNLKPYAVVWHEAITGRSKEDIVSTFFAFLKWQRDATRVIIWLDNCSSQNKNWCLFTFLIRMVNSDEISANEIIINYFEPGHTFMSADSFHHLVELSLKKQNKTYDFNDFINAVQNANKRGVVVKKMEINDFYKWKDLKSKQKLKNPNRPYLSDIVHVKAERGKYVLKYKTSLQDGHETKTLDFLLKNSMQKKVLLSPVESLSDPSGFAKEKKELLLKTLDGIIPENRKDFWINLPLPME